MTALKIPVQDRTLAMNLLKNQSQQLQTSHGYSHRAYPKRGVAQGASESPTLFSWFLEPLIGKLKTQKFNLNSNSKNCTKMNAT